MTTHRYGMTLRHLSQLNLRRLEYCDFSFAADPRYPTFGTACFHRELTDFERNQLDLDYLGAEECGHGRDD